MTKADKEGQRKAPILRFKGFTDDWEQRKLEDLLKVNSGKDYKQLDRGNVPVYGTSGYMLSVNKSLSENDAIGIGRKGTIDKPQFLKAPFWTVDTLFFLTLKHMNDLNFIYYKFQNINWKKYDESTGVPSLTKNTINKIKISIPQLNEQNKIKQLFTFLDNLLALYDRKLKLLSQVKKYFLDNLFAEKEYPNLRFKYFKKDKWEKTSLNSIVTYSNGKAHEKEINNKGNLDLVMMNSITTGGRLITKKKILSPQDTLNKNDIVIVLSDIAKGELIGKSSVIPCDNQYVLNQRIGCLHPTLNIDSFFVSKYINQKNRYFKSHAAGTSQINLSRSDVLNCTIYIPKVDEQHCVSNFIINVEKIINFYEYKKRHIIQIKNILLNTMFI